MGLASAVLARDDLIRKQRRTIWGLVSALRSAQRAQAELAELLDQVLADG